MGLIVFVQNKPWKAEEARRLELQRGGMKVEKNLEEVRSPSATEASYSVRCKIHEVFYFINHIKCRPVFLNL